MCSWISELPTLPSKWVLCTTSLLLYLGECLANTLRTYASPQQISAGTTTAICFQNDGEAARSGASHTMEQTASQVLMTACTWWNIFTTLTVDCWSEASRPVR